MIKNKKDWVKTLSVLKPEDAEDLNFCIQQLQQVVSTGMVNEDSVKTIYNITTMLTTMKERHSGYVIAWLKQGYMED